MPRDDAERRQRMFADLVGSTALSTIPKACAP